jgi:hypothetical protein
MVIDLVFGSMGVGEPLGIFRQFAWASRPIRQFPVFEIRSAPDWRFMQVTSGETAVA